MNRTDLSPRLDFGTKATTPVFFVTGKMTTQPKFLTGTTCLGISFSPVTFTPSRRVATVANPTRTVTIFSPKGSE